MAEKTKLTGIEINGTSYGLGKAVYEEIGISLERFTEILGRDLYCPTLASAPGSSTLTYTDTDGEDHTFQAGQPCRWAEGNGYRIAVCTDITASTSSWYTLPTKVSELTNDSGYLTSHQDISGLLGKTEAESTYQKKGDYATKTDVSTAVANLVGEAPETLDTIEELSAALKNNADIVDVLNESVANKQDKVLKFEDMAASSWVSDSTYTDYPYRCDMACTGVTETMYAEVVFGIEQATSGKFAPLCETKADAVSIWSSENTSITVPTIIITK